jgi:hypothetical protein
MNKSVFSVCLPIRHARGGGRPYGPNWILAFAGMTHAV